MERGFRVPGSAAKRAMPLRDEFGVNFVTLPFDFTGEAAVRTAAGEVCDQFDGAALTGLADNAGLAVGKTWQSVAVSRRRF